MIMLSNNGLSTIELPPDLYWSDEYAWLPVEQTSERTITGAQVISVAARVAGRPITLQPEDDNSAWMSRETLEQLRNWAAVPGQVLQLTLRGVARDVIFRHQDGAGIEARPLVHFSEMAGSDYYLVTLRLMEI